MNRLYNWYLQETQNSNLVYDEAQVILINKFDIFLNNYNNHSFLHKLLTKHKPQKSGFYIYGGVGLGKSMLMNKFYEQFTEEHKTRIHFHEFMHNIHQELSQLKDNKNPLLTIAKKLKKQYKIIFLDEMHISDIATAMILKNLFENLFNQGILIITSSNYAPDDLYQDGLMRDRFIPAIRILKQQLEIVQLVSTNDYRQLNTSVNNLFLTNIPNSHEGLNKLFNKVCHNKLIIQNNTIEIQKRKIPFIKKSSNIIWFNFDILCGDLRSQLDYLELAQNFNWFIIENIHELKPQDKEMARRFTWLIDILYDENRKLIISSSCDIDKIYLEGEFAPEFKRTISRLTEMQTDEYLSKLPLHPIIET